MKKMGNPSRTLHFGLLDKLGKNFNKLNLIGNSRLYFCQFCNEEVKSGNLQMSVSTAPLHVILHSTHFATIRDHLSPTELMGIQPGISSQVQLVLILLNQWPSQPLLLLIFFFPFGCSLKPDVQVRTQVQNAKYCHPVENIFTLLRFPVFDTHKQIDIKSIKYQAPPYLE